MWVQNFRHKSSCIEQKINPFEEGVVKAEGAPSTSVEGSQREVKETLLHSAQEDNTDTTTLEDWQPTIEVGGKYRKDKERIVKL